MSFAIWIFIVGALLIDDAHDHLLAEAAVPDPGAPELAFPVAVRLGLVDPVPELRLGVTHSQRRTRAQYSRYGWPNFAAR